MTLALPPFAERVDVVGVTRCRRRGRPRPRAGRRDPRRRRLTNAFGTTTQGIDVVSTWTPLALRGNTVISAVFNHTRTQVTDNEKGLLNDRRTAEYAYALPRTRWNVGVTQRLGPTSLLGRLSYYGGWYDFDSGLSRTTGIYVPAAACTTGSSTAGRSSTWS